MPRGKFSDVPDHDFISTYKAKGQAATATQFGISQQAVARRRKNLESRYGQIIGPRPPNSMRSPVTPLRQQFDIINGEVIIGSDAHIWPGPLTTAQRAFIKFVKDRKPRAVIANGDVMDFSSISRHDPLGFEKTPTVADELAAAQSFMKAVEDAAPGNCKFFWPAGNHDQRFEGRLAKVAPEYARVHGWHLKDHFSPKWLPCYSVFINRDVVVKHRLSGGTGALRNNVLKTRKHTVTAHLHSQHVWPVSSYDATLYGVDSGMLAEPYSEAFSYTEDAPVDWRAGFVVLTFQDGQLLPPELVTVWGKNHVTFRGEIHKV